MIRIGLTGGIGSGKSTVAKVFETLGIPVYYADDAAKRLMNENEVLKEKIIAAFGPESYSNGMLNRPHISSIVFNDPVQLALLNAITHPATIADAEHWMQQQNAPYTVKEAALIFESGSQSDLDYVIGVYSPLALRLQRIIKRDNTTRENVLARMSKQIDEDIKMRLCDFIIQNDEQELVIPQVIDLHKRILLLKN